LQTLVRTDGSDETRAISSFTYDEMMNIGPDCVTRSPNCLRSYQNFVSWYPGLIWWIFDRICCMYYQACWCLETSMVSRVATTLLSQSRSYSNWSWSYEVL